MEWSGPDAEVLEAYRSKFNGAASSRTEKRWRSEASARFTSWVDIAPTLNTQLRAKESTISDLRNAGVQGAGAFN